MSVKERKIPALILFMITSILTFPPHTEAQGKPARSHPYGGTLVIGTKYKPTIINPILTTHTISLDIMNIVFNKLVRINSKGELGPNLAKTWLVSEEGLKYTFSLNKGVKFHDGIELTAEDIQFTLQQLIDPKNNSPYKYHFDLIKKIVIIDKYQLEIWLSKPFNAFLFELADREIVPKHILKGEDLHSTSFNYHPVGTGPFQFKSWDKETNRIELDANPDYFEGRPYLDNIIIKVYPDKDTLWAAFMREEVDFILFLNSEDYEIIKSDPAFKVYVIPRKSYYAILYNQKDPIWHDRELRKAVAHSVDTKGIMKTLNTYGIESTGPFHPDSMGFNVDVNRLEYDPLKAQMLLMHRGWTDVSTDPNVDGADKTYGGADVHGREQGIRQKGGRELELRLLVKHNDPDVYTMAKVIMLELSEVGIKTKVILYNTEDDFTKEFLEKHSPQAWLRLFRGVGSDPDESIGSWNSLIKEPNEIWNYKNEEVDRIIESAKSEKDNSKRENLYKQMHKIIYDDQPACFLYFPMSYHALSNKFKNTDDYFSSYMPVYTLKDWYVKEK